MPQSAPLQELTQQDLNQGAVLHPLLIHAKELRVKGKTKRFLGGIGLSLKSIAFLFKNPKLWPAAIIPAVINIILFLMTSIALLYYSGPIVDGMWTRPDAWYFLILWWIIRVLIIPILMVVSYGFTLIVGTVIAAPFLTTLSEKTESIFVGHEVKGPTDMASNIRGALTALIYVLSFLVLMVPIFAINIIPVAGSAISTLLGGVVSAFFLSLEYTDYVLDRRKYTLKEKFKTIWNEKPYCFGLGLGISAMLWIPMVNFLTMPIAVISATAVAISLDEVEAPNDDETE